MTFIPQAIAHEPSRGIILVFNTREHYEMFKDMVKTVDAPGIPISPQNIKAGMIIDYYQTGWTKSRVKAVNFRPQPDDSPWQRYGDLEVECEHGFRGWRLNGWRVESGLPVFLFKE